MASPSGTVAAPVGLAFAASALALVIAVIIAFSLLANAASPPCWQAAVKAASRAGRAVGSTGLLGTCNNHSKVISDEPDYTILVPTSLVLNVVTQACHCSIETDHMYLI